jgi:glycopeptide antibiotics resistance protein
MTGSGVRIAFLIYCGYVLIGTFYPFELSRDLTPSPRDLTGGLFLVGAWHSLGLRDFVLNIILFLPCGALFYGLFKGRDRSKLSTIALVTLGGASVSFLIELGQVFLSRNSSALDIIANTLGTTLGALAYVRCEWWGVDPLDECARYLSSKLALFAVTLLGALPLLFSAEQFISPFWRWDSQYRLQFGNETTMNRPWLGKMYLVALYRRALSADEVNKNFDAGYGAGALMRRRQDDLIALYNFSEGAGDNVHDSSGFGPSLDLKLSPGPRIRWIEKSGGIEIAKRTIIKSHAPATKLVDAVREYNELSLEVWIAPQNITQDGPARIVSLSQDLGARNFTLGQEGADIQFRLRTPASGQNGTPLVLQTVGGVLKPETVHVAVTYKEGIERLYVNGAERPERINLMTDAIIGFGTRKTPAAQIAYSFFYFFPVAFVLAAFFSARSDVSSHGWLYAVVIALGMFTATELVQALAIERSIDLRLVGYGLMVSLFGTFSGRVFAGVKTCR